LRLIPVILSSLGITSLIFCTLFALLLRSPTQSISVVIAILCIVMGSILFLKSSEPKHLGSRITLVGVEASTSECGNLAVEYFVSALTDNRLRVDGPEGRLRTSHIHLATGPVAGFTGQES
jgi:hypothetical protein